jgi:hypothetical protein
VTRRASPALAFVLVARPTLTAAQAPRDPVLGDTDAPGKTDFARVTLDAAWIP